MTTIVKRPSPFVMVSTAHGTMIVNRNDYRMVNETQGYGMGYQLFNNSCYDIDEVRVVLQLLDLRHKHFGDGVFAIDCGANIGVHTVEWAKHMTEWGTIVGIEAQERLYYALAGNIAINNCLNASVINAAVGAEIGALAIPKLDYNQTSSFGSFELRQRPNTEFIGQKADYHNNTQNVAVVTIDSFDFERVDFIKIDVEGMEIDVLDGAQATIEKFHPLMVIEIIKTDREKLMRRLGENGYYCYPFAGINIIAVHKDDPSLQALSSNKALQEPLVAA